MFSISKSTTGGQEMYWGGLEWLVLAGGQIEKSEWNGKRRRRTLHKIQIGLSGPAHSTHKSAEFLFYSMVREAFKNVLA